MNKEVSGVITDHALKRLKKRTGFGKKTLKKLVREALSDGLKHSEAIGRLLKYYDYLYLSHKNADNIKIYKNFVFLFQDYVLITMFPLTGRYQKDAQKQIEQRRCKNGN